MHNPSDVTPIPFLHELLESWPRLLVGGVVGASLGLGIALLSPPSYQADVLLAPVKHSGGAGGLQALSGQLGGIASLAGVSLGGDSEEASSVAMLKSRLLATQLIEEENLLPVLFAKKWDAARKQWKSGAADESPTVWDGERRFSKKVRRVSEDRKTGLVTLTVVWTDPGMASHWATELVSRTNRLVRARAIETAQTNITYLRQQLDVTNIVEVRQSIYRLLEEQLKQMMLAQGDNEYAFKVLDPAVSPRKPSGPGAAVLTVAGALLGGLIACALVLLLGSYRPKS